MKIMTVLGTRPEIIRLIASSTSSTALRSHVLVYTGQNFDPRAVAMCSSRSWECVRRTISLGVRGETLGGADRPDPRAAANALLLERPA